MELKFTVAGMTCAACSARVEKVTKQVSGVRKAEVNLLAGTMYVEAEQGIDVQRIIAAVRAAGYDASVSGSAEPMHEDKMAAETSQMKRRIIGSFACLIVLMYFTMGHMIGLPVPGWYHGTENAMVAALLQAVLTVPVVYLNRVYYTKGLKALWHRSPNMDSLIAVGSGAALTYGIAALFRIAYAMGRSDWQTVQLYSENLYFESAAMILTLITVGKFLESRAKGKTGDAIRQLMDLSPKTAAVYRDGQEVLIPVEDVKAGDRVIVRSGGSVPVDGTVLSGRASVDQSALTGESVPVEKNCGDSVAAGTIAAEGYLEIRADKIGADTTLSQIIRLVEQAGGSKAPVARLADRIAGFFVPAVMIVAAITFAAWMIAGKSLEFAMTTGIAVLVISCPCALGLATPVAIMVGTGRAARMGVLFKNAEALENLHRVDTVVLDKTGTLTNGKPEVTDILPGTVSCEELLMIAASLEVRSEHPFAKAIMKIANKAELQSAEKFESLPGIGISAIIGEKRYYGGNGKLMEQLGVQIPEYPELTCQGKTPLYFASADGLYLGAIAAADTLKTDSAVAVKALLKQRIDVIMLTGDNKITAEAIAVKAGISHVIADVLPGDKEAAIAQLQREGKKVLMVGDGINDAPALVRADIGMAIGAGTDIAIESANVVLMNSSLHGVSDAIALSRATIRNIRQNLFWAFFYNVLGIPVAAGVLYPAFQILLSPMIGAAAMSLSSVFVVSNALRLRFFKCVERASTDKLKEELPMTTVIHVEGMMCTHCKARVENVCKAVTGTVDAVVDLQNKQVTVTGDAPKALLIRAIIDAGYEVVG